MCVAVVGGQNGYIHSNLFKLYNVVLVWNSNRETIMYIKVLCIAVAGYLLRNITAKVIEISFALFRFDSDNKKSLTSSELGIH